MKQKRTAKTDVKICVYCKLNPAYSHQAIYCLRCSGLKTKVKTKVYSCNKRASRLGRRGSFTLIDWLALCDFYDNRCLRCKNQFPLHLLTPDHVVPLATGGLGFISNIQPLCEGCNQSKFTNTKDYRDIPMLGSIP